MNPQFLARHAHSHEQEMRLAIGDGLQGRSVFRGVGLRIEIFVSSSNLQLGMFTSEKFRTAVRYAWCGAKVENAPLLSSSSLHQVRKPICIGDAMIAARRIAE